MSEEKGIYQVTGKKTFKEILDSPEMEQCRKAIRESKEQCEKDVESFWDNLSYDDKLKAFYYVCSKIYKSDVEDRGSYRYHLYETMNFDMDSYSLGMDCHYLTMHNIIYDGVDFGKMKSAKEIEFSFGEETHNFTIPKEKLLDFTFDEESNKLIIKTKNWMELV